MDKIKIAVRKFEPFETTLEKLWVLFCEQNGLSMEAEMVPLELHDLYEQTILNGGLKNGDWDIAHINTDWIFDAVNNNCLLNLKDKIADYSPQDFPEGWHSSLLHLQQIDGGTFGLPFHDGPECLIFRKDLFEDINEQENFEKLFRKKLQPPKTWDDFVQIAEFFNRPDENLFGCVFANYPDGHNMVFDFCLQLWTRGGSLLNEQNEIDLQQSAAIQALDFYRTIVNNKNAVHPKVKEFGSVEAGMAFANGEAAMAINWFGFASMCEVIEASKVKGKVDICELPADGNHQSASLNVYWLYTIASGSKKQDLAYEFIQFATSASSDKLLTKEGGIGCRKSTWTDEEINQTIPYYHKLEQLHENALTLPQIATWPKVASLIDEMIIQALESDISSENLINITQSKIKEIA